MWPWPAPLIRDNDLANALAAALQSRNPAAGARLVTAAIDYYRARQRPELFGHWLAYRIDFAGEANDRAALLRAAEELARVGPPTPQSLLKLAVAWFELGQPERARPIVAQLRQLDPNNATVARLAAELGL